MAQLQGYAGVVQEVKQMWSADWPVCVTFRSLGSGTRVARKPLAAQPAGECHHTAVNMARQGVRVLRPTRPAGPIVDLAELDKASPTRDDDLNFALARSAGSLDDGL